MSCECDDEVKLTKEGGDTAPLSLESASSLVQSNSNIAMEKEKNFLSSFLDGLSEDVSGFVNKTIGDVNLPTVKTDSQLSISWGTGLVLLGLGYMILKAFR